MRILLTGATGFVGHHLAHALLAAGHDVKALIRSGHERRLGKLQRAITPAYGDLTQPHTLPTAVEDVDAVINLVGIIKEAAGASFRRVHWEGARDLIDAAKAAGVRRFLEMSANGVKPDGTPYQATKFQAEEYLRGSGLEWTIFRPSVIFGEPHGRLNFVTELATPLRLVPAFPLFGEGDFPLQPVHVADVAQAFTRALASPATVGQTYCLGGPEALPYRLVVRIIATALGRPDLPLLPLPLQLVQAGVALAEWLPGFPLTTDQLAMLLEGNACDDRRWQADLGITPRAFTPEALSYLTHPEPEADAPIGATG
jgi:NADH dehydrogenase